MTINFHNSEKILRLTPVTKETKEIADRILEGDVRVFPKLTNVKVKELSELWEMRFEASPSTYALYVYALYPVSYLLNAYETTEDTDYLHEALKLALNFIEWESGSEKKISKKRLKILFGDHAVSNRTQTLCYLLCCLKSSRKAVPEDVISALLKNGEYLADVNNYSHYNHGLMMDLALLGLLNSLEGEGVKYPVHLKENLVARLQCSITRDLTKDGVHIENSPGYHFWMLGFLGKIVKPLSVLDKLLYLKAKDALSKASEYANYITRPDGSVPAIGDTHAGVRYKPSTGLESKFFRSANQVFFRSSDDEVWAHFASGYKTHVHKHGDNGAFNLFYKGKDIFIDPGFLNYESSEESKAIKSTCYHNTVSPIGENQNIVVVDKVASSSYSNNISSSKVSEFKKFEDCEIATALISEGGAFDIFRTVKWIKKDVFLILDKADFHNGMMEHVFNIAPGLRIFQKESGFSLYDESRIVANVVQVNFDFLGQSPEIRKAFFSDSFNSKACMHQLVFYSKTESLIVIVLGRDITFDELSEFSDLESASETISQGGGE